MAGIKGCQRQCVGGNKDAQWDLQTEAIDDCGANPRAERTNDAIGASSQSGKGDRVGSIVNLEIQVETHHSVGESGWEGGQNHRQGPWISQNHPVGLHDSQSTACGFWPV